MGAAAKTETDGGVRKAGRTASRQARRRQLIEATIESIARHGLSGTTMSSVTALAGLSTGLVNFHFETKQALFEETLRFLAEEHRNQWRKASRQKGLTAAAKLQAIVDAHFHPRICTRRKLAVWFAFFGESAWRSAYRTIVAEIDAERRAISAALCEDIIAEGGYDNLDGADVANALEAQYDGFWLNILMYPETFSHTNAACEINAFLSRTFPGHFQRSARPPAHRQV